MDDKNNQEITQEINDESELDKAIEESLNLVKAGKEVQPTEEPKTEEPKEEDSEEPKVEDTSNPPADEPKEGEEGYTYRIPNKGKFESDESYEKRIELMDLVKKRKLAKTEEARQEISEQIKVAKGQLKNLNGTDKFINPLNNKSETQTPNPNEEIDELLEADKERLRQLGGATKEDVEAILQQKQLEMEVKSTLDRFVDRHSQLADEDTREVFFDFVEQNYNWQNKSGKELMTVLELAFENVFKPAESITERVLKGANVQEKVNAMQFPGGTIAKTNYSPEMRKSLDELMSTGLSEEKALELLSD